MQLLINGDTVDGTRGMVLVAALVAAAALTLGLAPVPANGQTEAPPTEEPQPQGASAVEAAENPQELNVSLVLACATSVFCDEAGQVFSVRVTETADPANQTIVNLAGVPNYSGLNGGSPVASAGTAGRAVIWVAVMAVLIVGGLLIANAAT